MRSIFFILFMLLFIPKAYSSDCRSQFEDGGYEYVALNRSRHDLNLLKPLEGINKERVAVIDKKTGEKVNEFEVFFNENPYQVIALDNKLGEGLRIAVIDRETGEKVQNISHKKDGLLVDIIIDDKKAELTVSVKNEETGKSESMLISVDDEKRRVTYTHQRTGDIMLDTVVDDKTSEVTMIDQFGEKIVETRFGDSNTELIVGVLNDMLDGFFQ